MKRHENISDVDVRRIFRIAVIFVVVGAAIHLGVWLLFKYYRNADAERDVRQTLIEPTPPIPPEPRLQLNPAEDWQTYRRLQQDILNNYGWASREESRVHIPIERAMEKVVESEAGNASK
jgi:hypothetical protein